EKAIYFESEIWEIYQFLGDALLLQQKTDKAADAYLKAIALNPELSWSYYHLWQTLDNCGKLEEVLNLYYVAIQNNPDSVLSYVNLGEIFTQKGELKKAITSYQTASYLQTSKKDANFVEKHWNLENLRGPDFLIIGVGKGGTSSLYSYLCKHPKILPAVKKEIYFFSSHIEKNIDWYLSHFPPIPPGENFVTGEATPTYFRVKNGAEKVFEMFPKVKLIMLLRNPIDRAVSHYHHEVRLKRENRSLEGAIASLEKLQKAADREEFYWHNDQPYVTFGLYVEFIQKWMEVFPREQFLILKSEDFYDAPGDTMKRVFAFLGLPDYQIAEYEKLNPGYYPPINESIRQQLSDYFLPYNRRLEEYLEMEFNW
ncbi:MAG: tetratricopeptide repeat protein, partial [Okeania sp. SIO2H7]|nr:tetratricopeptide repeat protein [Okeania sp. SIO2H7]